MMTSFLAELERVFHRLHGCFAQLLRSHLLDFRLHHDIDHDLGEYCVLGTDGMYPQEQHRVALRLVLGHAVDLHFISLPVAVDA
jgi:hypothetical protein